MILKRLRAESRPLPQGLAGKFREAPGGAGVTAKMT